MKPKKSAEDDGKNTRHFKKENQDCMVSVIIVIHCIALTIRL